MQNLDLELFHWVTEPCVLEVFAHLSQLYATLSRLSTVQNTNVHL